MIFAESGTDLYSSADFRFDARMASTTGEFSVLPRLKDDKAIGVADVDPPEEPRRKQSIYLNFRGMPIVVACERYEG